MGRQRQYLCTVPKSSGNFGRACSISRSLRRTFGPHGDGQTLHWTDGTEHMPFQLRSAVRRTESPRIREDRTWQKALHEVYIACTVRIGLTDCISPEVGRFSTIPNQQQKVKQSVSQESLPNPAKGRMFGLPRRSMSTLDVTRQFCGIGKFKSTTETRTSRHVHHTTDCTEIKECGSVWSQHRSPSKVWWA